MTVASEDTGTKAELAAALELEFRPFSRLSLEALGLGGPAGVNTRGGFEHWRRGFELLDT